MSCPPQNRSAQAAFWLQKAAEAEAALANSDGGIVRIVIDGHTVQLDAAAAEARLEYYRRQAAKAAGSKPRVASIDLRRGW